MSAIPYSGLLDKLKDIFEGDTRTAGAKVFLEEDPQFGLQDVQQVLFVCFDGRTAPPRVQTMAAGTRTHYYLTFTIVTVYFSMDSFLEATRGRNALLGQMALVLMENRNIGELADSSWLEGGPVYSARNPQTNVWAAIAETKLIIDVVAITP